MGRKGEEHLETLTNGCLALEREGQDRAVYLQRHFSKLSFKKKNASHQAYESDGKSGVKSKETPCLSNPTVTPPVQQLSIPQPSGQRRICHEYPKLA